MTEKEPKGTKWDTNYDNAHSDSRRNWGNHGRGERSEQEGRRTRIQKKKRIIPLLDLFRKGHLDDE